MKIALGLLTLAFLMALMMIAGGLAMSLRPFAA